MSLLNLIGSSISSYCYVIIIWWRHGNDTCSLYWSNRVHYVSYYVLRFHNCSLCFIYCYMNMIYAKPFYKDFTFTIPDLITSTHVSVAYIWLPLTALNILILYFWKCIVEKMRFFRQPELPKPNCSLLLSLCRHFTCTRVLRYRLSYSL